MSNDHQVSPRPAARALQVRFTGSGSEYFRIWIVNLLLIVLTLSLYYPWARIRRLRYFASNTWIGNEASGQHALEFTGQPTRMLRGYVLMVAILLVALVAGQVWPTAGSIAFLLLIVVVPFLTWASLRFRLGNTRWRGLHFAFAGRLTDAYRVYQPLLTTLIVGAVAFGLIAFLTYDSGIAKSATGVTFVALSLANGVAWLLCLYRLVRYRQDHLVFGNQQARLTLGAGRYLWLLVQVGLLTIVLGLVAIAVVTAATSSAGLLASAMPAGPGERPSLSPTLVFGLVVLLGLLPVAWQILIRAWLTAREQNLVWSHTVTPGFAFHSDLKTSTYVGRSLMNGLLAIVTLGLYQPFAAVNLARLRLEALSITADGDLEAIVASAQAGPRTTDAGADVFDVDVGL